MCGDCYGECAFTARHASANLLTVPGPSERVQWQGNGHPDERPREFIYDLPVEAKLVRQLRALLKGQPRFGLNRSHD